MGTSAKMIGDDISLWQIMAIRQLVLLLFLIPLFRREGRKCFQTNVLGLHLLRVLFAAVALVCGLYAVRHLSLADATVIGFSKVMFATVAAWLLFGEGVGIRRALATTVGFAGVVVVVNPSGDAFNLSGLVAVAGAAGAGVVVNILRKLAQRESTERMILYQASLIGLSIGRDFLRGADGLLPALPRHFDWATIFWRTTHLVHRARRNADYRGLTLHHLARDSAKTSLENLRDQKFAHGRNQAGIDWHGRVDIALVLQVRVCSHRF